MKTRTKVLILALSAILLVVTTVFATVAYLTSMSVVITNTFTVGNVTITLDEANVDVYGVQEDATRVQTNEYKLIPNHTYTKDPTIHVGDDSENCFLFVYVNDGIAAIEAADTIATQMANKGWKEVDGVANVYYYSVNDGGANADNLKSVAASADVAVFDNFTTTEDAIVGNYTSATIVVKAYAIQADGFDATDAKAVWTASGFETP